MTQSEIARIREQIEKECIALHNLSLFTSTASHAIIQARFKALDECHKELQGMIGETQATETVVSIYNEVVK